MNANHYNAVYIINYMHCLFDLIIIMVLRTLYRYSDLLTDIIPLHTRHERVVSGCTGEGEAPLQCPTTSAPDVGEGGNAGSGHV